MPLFPWTEKLYINPVCFMKRHILIIFLFTSVITHYKNSLLIFLIITKYLVFG